MSLQRAKILEALKNLAPQERVVMDADVVSVDETSMTCTVKLANGQDIQEVQLKALKEASDCVVIVPVVGSTVQMIRMVAGWLVISCDEVDKVIVKAATKVQIDCEDVEFNGGGNDGLAITKRLVERLNLLEKDINELKQVFAQWSPVSNDGGAALRAKANLWLQQLLTETQQADIENPKVKH